MDKDTKKWVVNGDAPVAVTNLKTHQLAGDALPWQELYEGFKTGRWRDKVGGYRVGAYDKEDVPVFTPHAVFPNGKRGRADAKALRGRLQIDIDTGTPQNRADAVEILAGDEGEGLGVEAIGKSVGGDNHFAILRVEVETPHHLGHWVTYVKHRLNDITRGAGDAIADGQADVARCRFVTFDPDFVCRQGAEPLRLSDLENDMATHPSAYQIRMALAHAPKREKIDAGEADLPWHVFNSDGVNVVVGMMEKAGWKILARRTERWRGEAVEVIPILRPTKTDAPTSKTSGDIVLANGIPFVYVHSSSQDIAPLPHAKPVSMFDAYCLFKGISKAAAATELAARGFGRMDGKEAAKPIDCLVAKSAAFWDELPDIDTDRKALFEYGGNALIRMGSVTTIQGKKGSYKSTFATLMAAAVLNRDTDFLGFKCMVDDCHLVVVDTEQDKIETAQRVRGILSAANVSAEAARRRMDVWRLRLYGDRRERTAMIRQGLAKKRAATNGHLVILLDVITDLADMMDSGESFGLVSYLNMLCEESDCTLIAIIHENPNAATEKARGHLGTELVNKSANVLSVKKDEDTKGLYGRLTFKYTRGAAEFADLLFERNDDGGLDRMAKSREDAIAQSDGGKKVAVVDYEQAILAVLAEHSDGINKDAVVGFVTKYFHDLTNGESGTNPHQIKQWLNTMVASGTVRKGKKDGDNRGVFYFPVDDETEAE